MEITLDQLLASRDQRWNFLTQLAKEHQNMTIVYLTIVMPGSIKRNSHSLIIAQAATTALINAFSDCTKKTIVKDLPTGYEAYFITSMPALQAKRIACDIEENHPLGRLFDIDVLDSNMRPVSRTDINLAQRKCLICDNEARFCMRNHTHTKQDIDNKIAQMITDYVQ